MASVAFIQHPAAMINLNQFRNSGPQLSAEDAARKKEREAERAERRRQRNEERELKSSARDLQLQMKKASNNEQAMMREKNVIMKRYKSCTDPTEKKRLEREYVNAAKRLVSKRKVTERVSQNQQRADLASDTIAQLHAAEQEARMMTKASDVMDRVMDNTMDKTEEAAERFIEASNRLATQNQMLEERRRDLLDSEEVQTDDMYLDELREIIEQDNMEALLSDSAPTSQPTPPMTAAAATDEDADLQRRLDNLKIPGE